MDSIFKGGTIINADGRFVGDVHVRDGKIVALGTDISHPEARCIDVRGKYILPGAVDAHTHLEMYFNKTTSADDYYTGTRAAACGGVTTVFDFAVQIKGESIVQAAQRRDALCAPKACVDYAFHVALTDLTQQVLAEFEQAVAQGFPSFKLFMVYKKDGLMMSDADIYTALERARETGALISVHAENPDVLDSNIATFLGQGHNDPWYHYLSRPESVEAEAVKRAIHWAKTRHAPLYIVHLSSADGLAEIEDAQKAGHSMYAETCPHYLHFTREVYQRKDGRNFVCSPPMKAQESQDALWRGIRQGSILVVATDHCPFRQEQKDEGKDDFTKIPNGCMGIETLYPYMLHAANTGRISFEKAVALCARNPARIFGCSHKGSIAPGQDADLVVFDAEGSLRVSVENMHSQCDYTIWEGLQLKGRIESTYSRGRAVYHQGDFVGEAGWGRLIRRAPHQLWER